jgi:hypothetical protein
MSKPTIRPVLRPEPEESLAGLPIQLVSRTDEVK